MKQWTDRDMRLQIQMSLSGEPVDGLDARIDAIFDEIHKVHGLIDVNGLVPSEYWAIVEQVDAKLAEQADTASKTEPIELESLPIRELISEYAASYAANRIVDDPTPHIWAELERRLTLIERYAGTEASHIKSILATGKPIGAWLHEDVRSDGA